MRNGASLLAILLAVGCGAGNENDASQPPVKATVTGRVTFSGKPLSSGTVTFRHADSGTTGTGRLDSDGRYQLEALTGENQVGIQTDQKTPFPASFGKPESSPIKFDVKPGENRADFALTAPVFQ